MEVKKIKSFKELKYPIFARKGYTLYRVDYWDEITVEKPEAVVIFSMIEAAKKVASKQFPEQKIIIKLAIPVLVFMVKNIKTISFDV
jgi:hypothetical protein